MTENTHKIFVTTGASNHTETARANFDLYTTDPQALERFLDVFNLNKNVWECACVDYDTEYFNGKEWVKIGEYKKGDYVLSYIPETNSSMLVIPNEYIKTPYKKDFFVWKSKDLNMTLSENHRVVFLNRRKNTIQVKTAKEVFDIYQKDSNGFRGKIPTTWQDLGGNLIVDEWLLRLAIACNADGKMESKKKTCLIRVKKERKKERLEWLLKQANIPYKYKYFSKEERHSFFFENPLNNKLFPCEWLNLTRHLREIFIEEVAYWDGHTTEDGNTIYFSSKKHDIDIVQMIAHSIGINAKVNIDDRTEKRKNTNISYRLSFKRACTNYSLSKKNKQHLTMEKSKDGFCYCFNVPSSMLILRRENKIFITGNCGLGHLSEVLRKRDYKVYSTDINNYGYTGQNKILNFLSSEVLPQANEGLLECDILTNPPYSESLSFVKQALNIIEDGYNVVMFLRLQFLEGQARKAFFENNPPKEIYVFSKRMNCINPFGINQKSSAICYAWFVWQKGFKGDPIIKWL